MTLTRVFRSLLVLGATLLVLWSFVHVGTRWIGNWFAAVERPITLDILHWGNNDEERIVQELVDAFEAEHPNIAVRRLHTSDYDAKLKTMLAANTPPDLFYLRHEDVAEFADPPPGTEQTLAMNIQPLVDADPAAKTWLEDFYPVLLNAFRWDRAQEKTGSGPLHGIPKDFTTMVMYINLDLFERAGIEPPYDGWTWDEYRDAMAKVAALEPTDPDDQRPIIGGVLKTYPAVFRNLVWSFGGSFFGGPDGNDFTDIRLDEEPALQAMRFIRQTREDGIVYNARGLSQNEDNLFLEGRIGAIGPLGRWMTPRYRRISEFNWDVVPVPHAEGVEPVSGIATVAWAISSDTEHPEAAYKLLKFLTDRRGQRMTAELGLAMPTMRSVGESDAFLAPDKRPEHAEIFLQQIEHSRLGQNPRLKQFDQILENKLRQTLVLDWLNPEQAARQVETEWHAELNSPLAGREYGPMPWSIILSVIGGVLALGVGTLWWFARREKLGPIARAEERIGWMFISPWAIGFLLFILGPLIVALLLAVTKWSAMEPLAGARFVGLDNFTHMFQTDSNFTHSLWVTLYFVVLFVPVTQVAAIGVALLMSAEIKGIGLFRTAYFVPSVVTGVALATLWIAMFHSDSGIINNVLNFILNPFGMEAPDWFGNDGPVFAMPALVIMALWGVGGSMVIYLAGLKNIPGSLYEAARIDGAGAIRQFFAITLPMLSPLVFFNLVMGVIYSFQFFTHAYVITNTTGGSNDSLLLYVLYLFYQAFRFHNMGYASAMAAVLFAILLVLTLLLFRSSKGWVHYEGLKA